MQSKPSHLRGIEEQRRRSIKGTYRFLAVAVSACALLAQTGAGALDLKEIRTRGALRVLAAGSADKFFLITGGPAPGIDREILEDFARLQRVKLEIVQVPSWGAIVQWLLDGKGDVIAGAFTVTESRRKLIAFTPDVFPVRHVVVTHQPHRPVMTVEELRQERIGLYKGTSIVEIIAPLKLDPSRLDDAVQGDCAAALVSGRVTACIVSLDEFISEERQHPGLQTGMVVGPPYSYAFGVRKDDPELLRALSDFVDNVRRSGAWNRLVVKYFGEKALETLKAAR